jgi:hypothetical protein
MTIKLYRHDLLTVLTALKISLVVLREAKKKNQSPNYDLTISDFDEVTLILKIIRSTLDTTKKHYEVELPESSLLTICRALRELQMGHLKLYEDTKEIKHEENADDTFDIIAQIRGQIDEMRLLP